MACHAPHILLWTIDQGRASELVQAHVMAVGMLHFNVALLSIMSSFLLSFVFCISYFYSVGITNTSQNIILQLLLDYMNLA